MSPAPHFGSLSNLLAAVSTLDLGHASGRRTAATVEHRGSTWIVSWETTPERLIEFCEFVLAGGSAVERVTPSGRRALSDRAGEPEHLYLYEGSIGGGTRVASQDSLESACCGMIQPRGTECAACGEIVA